jgi:hypothetical protein
MLSYLILYCTPIPTKVHYTACMSTEMGLEGDVEFTYRGFESKTLGLIYLPSSLLCDFFTRKDSYFSLEFENGCKS